MKRGEYRGIYAVLHGDEDFQKLSSEARHLIYALKIELGRSGIECVMAFRDHMREVTNLTRGKVEKGLQELQDTGWLVVDETGRILWLRNGLKFEPSVSLKNKNHRSSIIRHLRGLPERPIVREFAKYYSLPDPFGIVKALGDTTPQEELEFGANGGQNDTPQDVGASAPG